MLHRSAPSAKSIRDGRRLIWRRLVIGGRLVAYV